ncbi:glycosyltransferase family 2 protein, partial [Candidatus Margulisiibacteriota bacterium]
MNTCAPASSRITRRIIQRPSVKYLCNTLAYLAYSLSAKRTPGKLRFSHKVVSEYHDSGVELQVRSQGIYDGETKISSNPFLVHHLLSSGKERISIAPRTTAQEISRLLTIAPGNIGTESRSMLVSEAQTRLERYQFAFREKTINTASLMTSVFGLSFATKSLIAGLLAGTGLGALPLIGFLALSFSFIISVTRSYSLLQVPYHTQAGTDLPAMEHAPTIKTLIPAYKEPADVMEMTLWSAALQNYQGKRDITLLIDDPYVAQPGQEHPLQEQAESLAARINLELKSRAHRYQLAQNAFSDRCSSSKPINLKAETEYLAKLYGEAAAWFLQKATDFQKQGEKTLFFRESVLLRNAQEYSTKASQLRAATLPQNQLRQHYSTLVSIFDSTVNSFQRKKYQNLSWKHSKAANLNTYLSLMGKSFQEVTSNGRSYLVPGSDLDFETFDYFLILDADTVVSPSYLKMAVACMKEDGNEDLAVYQSSPQSYPFSGNWLEGINAASVSIVGRDRKAATRQRAAFWAGNNGLIRWSAFEQTANTNSENETTNQNYISCKTIVEDFETTTRLAANGWRIHTSDEDISWTLYPSNLKDMSPQRHRWFNGRFISAINFLRGGTRKGMSSLELYFRSFECLVPPFLEPLMWVGLQLLPFSLELLDPYSIGLLLLSFPLRLLSRHNWLRRNNFTFSETFHSQILDLFFSPVYCDATVSSIISSLGKKEAYFKR